MLQRKGKIGRVEGLAKTLSLLRIQSTGHIVRVIASKDNLTELEREVGLTFLTESDFALSSEVLGRVRERALSVGKSLSRS